MVGRGGGLVQNDRCDSEVVAEDTDRLGLVARRDAKVRMRPVRADSNISAAQRAQAMQRATYNVRRTTKELVWATVCGPSLRASTWRTLHRPFGTPTPPLRRLCGAVLVRAGLDFAAERLGGDGRIARPDLCVVYVGDRLEGLSLDNHVAQAGCAAG